MQMMRKMQRELEKIQSELAEKTIDVTSAVGL